MILYILGASILIYGTAFTYITVNLFSNNYNNTLQIVNNKIDVSINKAEQMLNKYMVSALTLSEILSEYDKIPEDKRRQYFSDIMINMLKKTESYTSVWTICENSTIDSLDYKYINKKGSSVLGNFAPIYYKNNDTILLYDQIDTVAEQVFSGKVYTYMKKHKKPTIIEPYYYSYTGKKSDEVFETNIVTPITSNNKFIGIIGIDISMQYIQNEFSQLAPVKGSMVYIITDEGNFLIHPDSSFIGKNVSEYFTESENKFDISNLIKEGETVTFTSIDPQSNQESMFIIKPVNIYKTNTKWAFCLTIPKKEIYSQAYLILEQTIVLGLIGFILISIIILIIARSITRSVKVTTNVLERVSQGDIKNIELNKNFYNDEIKDITDSLSSLISGLNSAANFAQQIGDGNLKAEYKLLSNKDILGASLIKMQKSLAKAQKAEKEKKQLDEKRNWVTHGLAEFGELIRQHNDNMEMFTMNIAKSLVEYVGAAQVAIYINKKIENDDAENITDIFELKAAIAYGKPVMLTKSFESGQELLGRVAEENKTIYLEQLPQNYVLLSPGMQDAKRPDNLLIAPIHINKTTMGVIELLSFKNFDEYEIDFVNQLCENIAAVVASVQMNIQTSQLLKQSQYQADELAQHEEEMRQNLEEMQATQEETAKKQEELRTYISTIKTSVMIAELDVNGRILDVSPQMSSVYGSSEENMKGKYLEAFISSDKQSQSEYLEFWDNVINKGEGKRYQKFIKRNKAVWLLETYTVIKKDGMLPKIVVVVVDKTEEKELSEKLKQITNK